MRLPLCGSVSRAQRREAKAKPALMGGSPASFYNNDGGIAVPGVWVWAGSEYLLVRSAVVMVLGPGRARVCRRGRWVGRRAGYEV